MRNNTVLLVLATLLVTLASAQAQSVGSVRGGSRDRAPVLDARDFNIKNYEGRVVLVAFWRVGDEESDIMAPWLSDLQGRYGQDGLTVVAVNLNSQSSAAAGAVGLMDPHIQVVLDPTSRLATHYQLGRVPSGFLYDRAGGDRDSFAGFRSGMTDTISVVIEELLKEKPE